MNSWADLTPVSPRKGIGEVGLVGRSFEPRQRRTTQGGLLHLS
jgi:hypothetical protein